MVKEFLMEWNKTHNNVQFSAYKASGSNRLTSVEVRYPELGMEHGFYGGTWDGFNFLLDETSRGIIVATTNLKSFENGIIQLLIASRSKCYDENLVIRTLEWVGNYLEELL